MAAGSESDKDARPATTARVRRVRVPRTLRVAVRLVQIAYYTLAVWKEL
jgi:hypothetical protein